MNFFNMKIKFKSLFSLRRNQIFLIVFWLWSFAAKAQENVVHTGERITISSGENLYIFGSFESRSSVNLAILNRGTFNLQGDLIHNGTQNLFGSVAPNQGTLRFFGAPTSFARIRGNQTINLKNLIIELSQPALSGNVLLRMKGLNAYGNLSFVKGGLDIDTNNLYLIHDASSVSAGIIAESIGARPLTLVPNSDGKIVLLNYPWQSGQTYGNIKGMGLSFKQLDPLGGTPTLTRTFFSQACGDSAGHTGSIQRVFRMEGNSNPAQFNQTAVKFLNPSEMDGNISGSGLRIFVSEDRGQVWRQRLNNTGTADSTTSSGNTLFSIPQNFTVITAATPCNSAFPIQINQIITALSPNDTLVNISSAIACDPNNVSAFLYATGEPGSFFEWRSNNSSFYFPQSPLGYYEAQSLGTYWVRMTNIRGCMDSISINVQAVPPGNSTIAAHPSQICLGSSVAFAPDSIDLLSTYHWDFGDGTTSNLASVNHTYLSNGTYTITLQITTAQNCNASTTSTIIVHALPNATFAVAAACPGTPLNFDNNSSVISLPTLVSLHWNFGDLSSDSSLANISGSGGSGDVQHSFATEGEFIVSLTATANGCISPVFIDTLTIYPLPNAAFTFGPACQGLPVSFTNTSSISDASPMTYFWDFTGGGPSTIIPNPSYSFSSNGTYTTSLIATSVNGCADTTSQSITIYQNPIVNFSVTNACVNSPATFSDLSTAGLTPYSYAWNFGDGNLGSQQNEAHSYSLAGNYTVSLVVTTANGCTAAANNTVTIFPGPNVSFTVFNACKNAPVNFVNTSTNAISYLWNFPSLSSTSTLVNPTETFVNDGTFPVQLTASSANGCQGNYAGSITIYPLPSINLGSSISTCGNSYLLDANQNGVNAGSNFLWSTGAISPQFNVTYNGTFSVTVTSQQSCSYSDTVQVTLNSAVVPPLGPDAVFCDSTVLDAGYPGSTYAWSTGASTQTIKVNNTGVYWVVVTDQNNCSGSDTIAITIVPATPVSLGADIIACASSGVLLNAGIASSYLWNTGATTSTLQVPASGYYWVKITNGGGCSSSDTIQVTLNPSPVFSIGPDITACNQTVLNAFALNSSFSWNTAAITPSITVSTSGTYWVEVTDNSTTCSSTDSINVVIHALPQVNLGNDTTLCSYQTISLNAGNPGASYLWNSGQTTASIIVSTQGLYEVTVTDANACSTTDQILVLVRPVFSIDLGVDKQFCPGSTIILDAGLTNSGNSYVWQNASGIVGTAATFTVLDTGMHYLVVNNNYNCIATDSVRIVPSNNSLFAVFLSDSEIDKGDSLVLINLSHPRPYTSQWYIDNILVSTDSTPTIAFTMPVTPPVDTVFTTLKVSNAYCTSVRTKPIVVNSGLKQLPDPEEIPIPTLFTVINHLNLYPNPNNGLFYLFLDINKESYTNISIYSLTGAMVFSENRTLNTGILPFNFEQLSPGMYFFSLQFPNERRTLKFIKTPY